MLTFAPKKIGCWLSIFSHLYWLFNLNHPRSDRAVGEKSLPFHQGIGSKNLAIYTPPKSWLCGLKILECWLLPIFFLECWLLRLRLSMVNADFWLKKNLDADFCPKNGGYKVWMLTSATPPSRPPLLYNILCCNTGLWNRFEIKTLYIETKVLFLHYRTVFGQASFQNFDLVFNPHIQYWVTITKVIVCIYITIQYVPYILSNYYHTICAIHTK